jgi:hypothetical protein
MFERKGASLFSWIAVYNSLFFISVRLCLCTILHINNHSISGSPINKFWLSQQQCHYSLALNPLLQEHQKKASIHNGTTYQEPCWAIRMDRALLVMGLITNTIEQFCYLFYYLHPATFILAPSYCWTCLLCKEGSPTATKRTNVWIWV